MANPGRSRGYHRLLVTLPAAVLLALATGCGSVPLDGAAPEQFDLNGRWVLDANRSSGTQPRGRGFIEQDFPLLVSREMHIEQDARSMGIEYDRGSYRDVTWGERRRGVWEVRAGWREGSLYIYSEAPDISAMEVWQLSADGDELSIQISVRGGVEGQYQRVFRRSLEI
ncbi:MAG: hypothetical protein AB7I04_03870 [Pseudomonadales bacterium]